MGNRKARDFILNQQDDTDWKRVQSETRLAIRDVHARGIGQRRLQLIECPSFGHGQAWEVRQSVDWCLYRSKVVGSRPEVRLVGYDAIAIESDLLSSFFNRAVSLSLPIAPFLSDRGGADGDITQIAIFGGFSESRFQWWNDSPPEWKPLVDLAAEMLDVFKVATRRTN